MKNLYVDEKEIISPKILLILIATAYIFSLLVRYYWVFSVADIDAFYWNNQLMINTNDGYYWASGANAYLNGMHEFNPRAIVWYEHATSFFTVLATKFLPISLESVILYMPSVVSSLIVIPIILIMRLYNLTLIGFFAALIASIAWSYYNRTLIGYYDSDMFAVVIATFILYFVVATIEKRDLKYALIAGILMFLYPFFYDQGKSIVIVIVILYIIYKLVFHLKEEFTYKSIILMTLALTSLPLSFGMQVLVKLFLLTLLFIFFSKQKLTSQKYGVKILMGITTLVVIFGFYYAGLIPTIYIKISYYLTRGADSEGLKYFQVIQTIREAGSIPFSLVAKRIIGSPLGLIFAILGYILLVIRFRVLLLSLPLFGIGIFAYWGGLRFTVYAVPIASIAVVTLFYFISKFIISEDKVIFRYVATGLLSFAILYPNLKHVSEYIPSTVFPKPEVEILDRFKSKISPKDYTITWWDYAYPLWFYANTNTIIDGGKHEHDNFIVSNILTSNSQLQAANFSRVAIETYINSNYKIIADTLFKNKNPNEFLSEISKEGYKLPKKTVDVYLYLPYRMMGIFPTVDKFANRDLVSGKEGRAPIMFQFGYQNEDEQNVYFSNGLVLPKKGGYVSFNNQKMAINTFTTTIYQNSGTVKANEQKVDSMGQLYLIYMYNYKRLLLLDERVYNSLFIQLFVLENYDKELFEPVIMSPFVKIFKVKK